MTEENANQEQSPKVSKIPVKIDPKQDRLWGTFCHLSALLVLFGAPFSFFLGVNILGPLVIWLIKRHEMPLVNEEGREALNFQISMTIYTLVALMLCFIFIGFILILPVILVNVVLVIIASIKTSNGERFHYPITIRFIK